MRDNAMLTGPAVKGRVDFMSIASGLKQAAEKMLWFVILIEAKNLSLFLSYT